MKKTATRDEALEALACSDFAEEAADIVEVIYGNPQAHTMDVPPDDGSPTKPGPGSH